MLDFPRWKQAFYWLVAAVAMIAALPTLASLANVRWPSSLPSPMINLGLDLAGGSHNLLEANPDQVRRQKLETMEEDVRNRLKHAELQIRIGDISTKDGNINFLLRCMQLAVDCRQMLRDRKYRWAGAPCHHMRMHTHTHVPLCVVCTHTFTMCSAKTCCCPRRP